MTRDRYDSKHCSSDLAVSVEEALGGPGDGFMQGLGQKPQARVPRQLHVIRDCRDVNDTGNKKVKSSVSTNKRKNKKKTSKKKAGGQRGERAMCKEVRVNGEKPGGRNKRNSGFSPHMTTRSNATQGRRKSNRCPA